MTLPRELLSALDRVRASVDVTQQTIDAINDLREPVDADKLGDFVSVRMRWRGLEEAWQHFGPSR